MSRTFIRQATQIARSEEFNDTLADGGAGIALQSQESIEGDLNALRSIVKRISGEGHWYEDRSGRSLSEASADLDTANTNISQLQTDLSQEALDRASADSLLDGRLTTAEGEIDQLQLDVSDHGTRLTTAEGEIDTLQSDLAQEILDRQGADSNLQTYIDGKLNLTGGALTGGLTIDGGGSPALGLTTIGTAFTIADAVDGQFFEINTSLQQMTFSDPLGSGNVVVVDPAEVVVSTNDPATSTNIARTNIMSGVIELVQSGTAAVPTAPEHVVNKAYVDGLVQGLSLKAPAKIRYDLANGETIPSGPQTYQSVSLVAGDRILIVSEMEPARSGIYVIDSNPALEWSRAADFADGAQADGAFVFVQEGDYADTSWVQVYTATVGTGTLVFVQMFGPGTYRAGAGLEQLANNTFAIANGGVVESMLANEAVTADKIKDGAVMSRAIADSAVTNAKLAGNIDLSKLASPVYTKTEVDSALALKLNLAGGTMSGSILMNGNKILGLNAPTSDGAAANKKYVDDADALKLDLAGGTMSGSIAMGNNSITGLASPSASTDAANKAYVDSQMSSVQARGNKTFVIVTAAVTKDTDVSDTDQNIDAPLPNMSTGSFENDYDVFVNGALLRGGANAGTNNDYYPGSAATKLKFEFPLSVGDTICVVEYN